MADKANAQCAICGKDFTMKYHCNRNGSSEPWMAHCDTVEHYKIFEIVNGYTGGVYNASEAKTKLESVNLDDLEHLRPNIRSIIQEIQAGGPAKPKHDVTYSFKSGTSGHDTLPEGVNQKLPSTTQATEGDTVTPSAVEGTVDEGNGTWAFKEWQPASQAMDTDGIAFVGIWEWTEKPKHNVTYEFVSGTPEHEVLDSEVLAKVPDATQAHKGDKVNPTPETFKPIVGSTGTWTFTGWSPSGEQTMEDSDIKFTGTWTWAATDE